MNLTQTIEATVEFWESYYEIIGISMPIHVYNQLRTESNAFVVSASQIINGSAAAQIAGTMVTIVPDNGCFRVITGEPLPTAEFNDPNEVWAEPINEPGAITIDTIKAIRDYEVTNVPSRDVLELALENYRRGRISIKDFRREFVDDAPPPGLVWES
jgi:hypothetical protein